MTYDRSEIPHDDKWNVEAMYPNLEAWEHEFQALCYEDGKPCWLNLTTYQGKLADSPETLRAALDQMHAIERRLAFLYTYAHLRHDEDITNDQNKVAFNKIVMVWQEFHQATTWFEPELLSIPDDRIKEFLASPVLKDYRFHLEKKLRIKPYILPKEQERLMALAGQALTATNRAFRAINDADLDFGKVVDSKGEEHDLTHGTYGVYIRSHDRTLRENAYVQMSAKYEEYENTICELLNGQIQGHFFNARARGYASCLDASLFPKNIDVEVYHALIKAVRDNISVVHKYIALRKKILGLDKLHLYDLSVPLTPQLSIKVPYQEAEELIIKSVAPLGSEYQNALQTGFKTQRWVDRFENRYKRSGGYSSGCYDSMPYILMNYKEQMRDAFVLAHEAGHSMHSYLTHKYQPYQYGDYSIFLAEVASTFNEELLSRQMIANARTKEEKIYLLTEKIEDIRGTLFRQVQFAEFELFIHRMVETNTPLTPKLLRDEMQKLQSFYFGSEIVLAPNSGIEWARIPHFYYNFYVFQYATGLSAALALAEKVLSGGVTERDAYLNFLKGGSSRYPIEMLKVAGVDMRTPQPVKAAMDKFGKLLTELEKETGILQDSPLRR